MPNLNRKRNPTELENVAINTRRRPSRPNVRNIDTRSYRIQLIRLKHAFGASATRFELIVREHVNDVLEPILKEQAIDWHWTRLWSTMRNVDLWHPPCFTFFCISFDWNEIERNDRPRGKIFGSVGLTGQNLFRSIIVDKLSISRRSQTIIQSNEIILIIWKYSALSCATENLSVILSFSSFF